MKKKNNLKGKSRGKKIYLRKKNEYYCASLFHVVDVDILFFFSISSHEYGKFRHLLYRRILPHVRVSKVFKSTRVLY
jgi:hypothetical protein